MSTAILTRMESIRTFAEAEEVLASVLPNYERRDQQGELARSIEESLATNSHLIAQGPVGIGKSLAYLIPAVLSGRRTVVATATKALQDQLFFKDVPLLQEHLKPFEAALLKGRSNYICVGALMDADPADVPHLAEIMELITPTTEQAGMGLVINTDFSGERDDLPFEVENREWMKVAASTDGCSEYKCKDTGNCYAQAARQRAREALIVVVNHSLYVSDLVIQELTDGKVSMIGDHSIFIADEVHELPEYATNALGTALKESGIGFLSAEARNFGQRYGVDVAEEVRAVQGASQALFDSVSEGRVRFVDIEANEEAYVNLLHALSNLAESFEPSLADRIRLDDKGKRSRKRIEGRIVSTIDKLSNFMVAPFDEIVRWVEIEKERPVLKMAPVSVAPFLRDNLFGRGDVTAIMVSGTVAVNGSMSYVAGTLGVDEYRSLVVESPFDFESQARLYIPDLPDPKAEWSKWSSMSANEMLQLVRVSKGRALLLFTSLAEMRNAYELISSMVEYKCLMQGQRPNKDLVAEFKADTHSILFGTKSFMTGIDIQGESLSLLVLNKLTFPVPSEPMFEAKAEIIESRGGNSFVELSVPMMTLTLQQAFGRLIRSKTDTGVAVLLDPRVRTKSYGSGIIKSLPPMPQIRSLAEVEEWFA